MSPSATTPSSAGSSRRYVLRPLIESPSVALGASPTLAYGGKSSRSVRLERPARLVVAVRRLGRHGRQNLGSAGRRWGAARCTRPTYSEGNRTEDGPPILM